VWNQIVARLHELREPIEASRKVVARWRERGKPRCEYGVNHDWRERLGVMDSERELLARLWPSVIAEMEAQHVRTGPESYLYWNDGDPALIEAICCLIRRTDGTKIVENGLTSRFILETLNGRGHLWSIDLPPRGALKLHSEIGIAVGNRFKRDWTLISGPSRQCLPPLVSKIGPIDLFIHDSHHSEYNMMFEMAQAWPALKPGGAMVVDDIDLNWAFHEFGMAVAAETLICEAEPIRPDTRRFNQKGLFGIILKPEEAIGG
jgi:predicted O-methyltransferase YrrM